VKRAQGRPGAGWHPRSAARRCSAKRPHSSIQVTPNTRPSLHSGLTAYAALSPATSSFLSPSPCELTMAKDPVEPRSISARLDRSNDGQDHTILPYAAIRLRPKASPDTGAVRPHATGPHEVHLALVPPSRARRCRVHRTPIHVRYDGRSPLSLDRDGRMDNVIPNFGKVEYFYGEGLTSFGGRWVFCPTGQIGAHHVVARARQPRMTVATGEAARTVYFADLSAIIPNL